MPKTNINLMRSKDNRIITTFDGTKAVRKNCRYIRGQLYEKNKQCFIVQDQWHRINNGLIDFDYEIKKWVLVSISSLISGIVGYNKDGTFKYGKFTSKIFKNVPIIVYESKNSIGNFTKLIDESLFKKHNNNYLFGKHINLNYTYVVNKKSPESQTFLSSLLSQPIIINVNDAYPNIPVYYGARDSIRDFDRCVKNNFKSENIVRKGSELEDFFKSTKYSYGLEFETYNGVVPERLLKPNGLIPCRDGSISGFEYVTIPLTGTKGVEMLYKHINILNQFCSISINEVMHIHLGGYPLSEKPVMALWYLNKMLEEDIYSLFPKHYKDTSHFKRNSYCGPLDDFGIFPSKDFDTNKQLRELYFRLSGNNSNFVGFLAKHHPKDNSGRHKWYVNERYKWVNFIPLMFGTRGTIEYRVHTPTLNIDKIVNWVVLTQSILKYAEKHQNNLTSSEPDLITLIDIIKYSLIGYPIMRTKMLNYISYRKRLYSNDKDVYGKKEIQTENPRLPKELSLLI